MRARRYLLTACAIAALLWHIPGAAQSSTQFWPRGLGPFITIAWDPSPDPSVIGYIVYAGTQARGYTGAFDVGNRTSFVYPYAAVNRRHFFAVAAYSSGLFAGELSEEVSGFGRLVPPAGHVPDFNLTPLGTGPAISQCVAGVSCLEAATVSTSGRRINAVSSSAAGQLWFVEDRQRIFTVDVDGRVKSIERNSRRTRGHVDGLALDRRFEENRRVYIQEIEHHPDGSRELSISRYREVMGTLRERAVIVDGIRLPPTGSVPFAVDGDGRVFVAVPRDRTGPRPHDGVVFGVHPNGTYVEGPSGSQSWRGLSNPSSLVWDSEGRELWLSGSDGAGTAMVERVRLSSQPQPSHRTMTGARGYLLAAAPGGRLLRIDRSTARAETVSIGSGENVTAIADAGADVVFAVTRSNGTPGSRIVVIPLPD